MEHKSQILTEDQFKGNYHGSGSMVLTGTFDGSLTIDNLFITKSGKFLGKFIAKNIIPGISAELLPKHMSNENIINTIQRNK